MGTFVAVDDDFLANRIAAATRRVVFVAPAVSKKIADALGQSFRSTERLSITVVVDPDEEPYRLGYGDREGLEQIQKLATENHVALRSQPGLRIGLLLCDDDVLVWSPTPRAVEGQRTSEEPNGVDLGAGVTASDASTPRQDMEGDHLEEGVPTPASSLADMIGSAVGADDSDVLLDQAEIGREPLTPEKVEETVKVLKENPPAPFDLAQKTRVFSTKFQFVEFELRGAEWTKREIKLSSLLLNPDVPDELQDLFETRVKPFSHQGDVAVEVPALVLGQIAYNRDGKEILAPMTQAQIEKEWKELRERYLKRLPAFGWLIRRGEKEKFLGEVAAFETILKAWVKGFRKEAANDEKALVERIVGLISGRAERSNARDKLKYMDIKATVQEGIKKLRVTEPSVKLVFKEISWESTRDEEFMQTLKKSLPAAELTGWFEVFTAARQRKA